MTARYAPRRARKLYRDFHNFEPRRIGEFGRGFEIPERAVLVGDAVNVMYRSDKLNPSTGEDEGFIDYIHDHKEGVRVYRTDRDAEGVERTVPAYIWRSDALVRLGDCLGFTYENEDGQVEAKPSGKTPELYSIPSGKALLVVQDRRRVLALIWGGRLGVEARGIVY